MCPVDATCGGALLASVMTSSTSPDTSQHDRPVLATSSPPLILSYLPLLIGTTLPIPKEHYWSDRSTAKQTVHILRCPRETCGGPVREACWTMASVNGLAGDDDNATKCPLDVVCIPGSTGPLCGACDDGYTFNSLKQVNLTLARQEPTRPVP